MGLCTFEKQVTVRKWISSLITRWEGRVSTNWIEILNHFYSESHPSLVLDKVVPSLSYFLSSFACLATMIRGVRLERGLAESKNGCCPKEKKTNEPRLSFPHGLKHYSSRYQKDAKIGLKELSAPPSSCTLLSHVQYLEYLAPNSINSFIKVSPASCNICPAKTLGILLAVQKFSAFRKHKILT